MSEWIQRRLSTLGVIITGKTPSKDNPNEWGDIYMFITPTDYANYNKFANTSIRMLSEIGMNRHKTRIIPKNSCLVTCIGSDMGKAVINGKECFTNQQINSFIPNNEVSIDFIYYYFKDNEYLLKSLGSSGSAVPILNKTDFGNIEINLPPLPEQKAIADVLSALDDKIDLLHRQNHTLEQMAETLFRQWFVEEAQEDWEEKPLSSIATFTNGLACQKFPVQIGEQGFPVLKIKELTSGISDTSDWATEKVKPEYIVENGDIIFAWSASLMVKIWSGQKSVLNQHLFNVKSQDYPKWFYYEWCKFHLAEFIAVAQSHATTMGHIKRKDLDEAMVKIPSSETLTTMSQTMKPLLDKRIVNAQQIQTLETLRDTLLPKLISGEVRVNVQAA